MTNIEKVKKLRQSLENTAKQDLMPQKVELNQQHAEREEIFIEKNSVLSSYSKEIENLKAIDRLKYEYGIEKMLYSQKKM